MSGEALWPFALEIYGRPGVEAILLELQDTHGQCAPVLIWSLWIATQGRAADEAAIRSAIDLARAWQDAAIIPLRTVRRTLKDRSALGSKRAWERLRGRVKSLEIDAERMLLQMLESASPAPSASRIDARAALNKAVLTWGGRAPPELLERLAAAAL